MKIILLVSIFLASCATVDNRPNYVKLEEKKRQAKQNF